MSFTMVLTLVYKVIRWSLKPKPHVAMVIHVFHMVFTVSFDLFRFSRCLMICSAVHDVVK